MNKQSFQCISVFFNTVYCILFNPPTICLSTVDRGVTLYSVQCTVYTVHCTVYTVYCTLYTVHCTLYTVQCTLYTVYCTLYTVHYIVYSVHCTLYTVHCTLYTVHCTLYTVHCTLYTVHAHLSVTVSIQFPVLLISTSAEHQTCTTNPPSQVLGFGDTKTE